MWAKGTNQWQRICVMIVSADRHRLGELLTRWVDTDVVVVATPLEVLGGLEARGPSISTVVLADVVGSVTTSQLAEFIDEHYPYVRVIRQAADEASSPRSRPARELQHEAEERDAN